jgi:hypothetical protein
MASGAAPPFPGDAMTTAACAGAAAATQASAGPSAPAVSAAEPILCGHCGRTASNGISCQGMCVADSGY